jgi:glycine/D-amino acid oxidase-like deaminating enzyme
VSVQSISPSPGEIVLDTSAGQIRAATIVIATNAYTQSLLPEIPVSPVRGQMLATEPLRAVVAACPVYAGYGYRYWRQLDDGSLLIGGWRDSAMKEEVGTDDTPTDHIQGQLDRHLRELAPDALVARRWAGIMGFSPDLLPLVGPVPGMSRVFICGGYSGHGLNFAFMAARLLANHIASGTDLPSWMDPARFPPGTAGSVKEAVSQ